MRELWHNPEKFHTCIYNNPFHFGYRITGTLANSDDPDKMLQKAAFCQDMHCLLKINT